ncbi:HET-domain-containing protein [Lophium mytilinum]|uniref:HET-domain-containing protein n=1 Tax=Lophium mytilinum TaxID=390894 RepID=A0A6A6QHW3_9PEZI|nr:HET-domain-containing protein [Lophium mytilinum]
MRNPRQPLRYKPLQPRRKEIRLFRLKPKNYRPDPCPWYLVNVTVFGELEHVSRDGHVPYTALSYAWGDGVRHRMGVGQEELYISTNLEDALQQLQDDEKDVLLWADQICINQKDETERSEQVKQMREIYAEADRTIAWLGLAADDSDMVFDFLNAMSTCADSEQALDVPELGNTSFRNIANSIELGNTSFRSIANSIDLDDTSFRNTTKSIISNVFPLIPDSVKRDTIREGFDQVCRRSYWSRLWVIQEFAVARRLDVMCGKSSIPSCKLLSVLQMDRLLDLYLHNCIYMHCEEKDAADVVRVVLDSCVKGNVEKIVYRRYVYHHLEHLDEKLLHNALISTLVTGSNYYPPECSDPRDRVFALLGLADDAAEFHEFPDYTMSCKDVYTKTARKLIDQGLIDLLSCCQSPNLSQTNVPTWVPDWHLAIHTSGILGPLLESRFCASAKISSRQKISHGGPNLLTMRGIYVDTVKEFGSIWNHNSGEGVRLDNALRYLIEIKRFVVQSSQTSPGSEDDRILRIAIAGSYSRAEDPAQWRKLNRAQDLRELNKYAINSGVFQRPDLLPLDPQNTTNLLLSRPIRPFISTSGFVGLSPYHVQAGDVICIFVGANFPYLLRKCGDNWILVGETYVDGIMYGELQKCGDNWILVGDPYVDGIMYGEHMASSFKVEDFTLQ